MIDHLRLAYDRARTQSFFVAYCFAAFEQGRDANEDDLMALLACNEEQLLRAGLCRRPEAASVSFREEVIEVALHANVETLALLQVLREAETYIAFSSSPFAGEGYLMAARDQDAEPDHRAD